MHNCAIGRFQQHKPGRHGPRPRQTQNVRSKEDKIAEPRGLIIHDIIDFSGPAPFDRSEAGEEHRTEVLRQELTDAGATDIRTSTRREWATFVSPVDNRIYQLYWWQRLGVYMVGRYDESARLELIGQHYERRAAIDAALRPEATPNPSAA